MIFVLESPVNSKEEDKALSSLELNQESLSHHE